VKGSLLGLYPLTAWALHEFRHGYYAPSRKRFVTMPGAARQERLPQPIRAIVGRRGMAWIALLLLVLLVSAPASHALDASTRFRDYVLNNWSSAHGLPQISVLSITQDRDGFLWLGTQNGVARFDGQHFQSYERGDTGVDLSMVDAAWADAAGAVWFGTGQNLVREYRGGFEHWPSAAIYAIRGDAQGQPLLATAAGVGIWRNGRLQPIAGLAGPFFALLRQGDVLWAGGLNRLCRDSAGHTRCFALPAGASRRVTALAWNAGRLWVGTSAGLLQFDGQHFSAAPWPLLARIDIQSLLRDRAGNLWIGSIAALYRRYPDGRLETIDNTTFPPNPWIDAIFEDRDGNLWLGSHTQSLYRVANSWTARYGQDAGLDDPFVWTLAAGADGGIDIGTNGGLSKLADGKVTTLVPAGALPNPGVYSLYRDAQGALWIGTRGGVALWRQGRLSLPPVLAPLRAWQINLIDEYPRGTYWFGTQGGLYRLQAGALTRYGASPGSAAARIRALLPLANGALLLGTEDGVRELRAGHISAPAWAMPLRGHFVTSLGWLDHDTLLLTTLDAGLGLLRNGRLRLLTQQDGLPTDNAWAFASHGSEVYFSSIKGVWRVPLRMLLQPPAAAPGIRAQRVLTGNNRIGSEERTRCCNGGGGGRMLRVGDTLWLPSINGALALDMAAVRAPPAPSAPRIERLHHVQAWYATGATTRMPLGARNVEIEYTAPYLNNAAALNFRYRLTGYDNAWIAAGARRVALVHPPASRALPLRRAGTRRPRRMVGASDPRDRDSRVLVRMALAASPGRTAAGGAAAAGRALALAAPDAATATVGSAGRAAHRGTASRQSALASGQRRADRGKPQRSAHRPR
jgi:ligand-binding sensor domain-containing protein